MKHFSLAVVAPLAIVAVAAVAQPPRAPLPGAGLPAMAPVAAAIAFAANQGTPQPLGNEMPTPTGYYPPDGGGAPELFGGVGTDQNGNRIATPRPTASVQEPKFHRPLNTFP